MGLINCTLGKYVELYSKKCEIPNLTVWDISGVNSDKEFFEPSKSVGADTSNYKIVPPDYFACNFMHVGRDRVLPIALNQTARPKIVSPAYTVFKLSKDAPFLKEYFLIMLKSAERDRYFWFHTDSSVRDGMNWEDFCNLRINIPSIKVQQRYIDIYRELLENQQCYETSLGDLKFTCDALIEKFKHSAPRIMLRDIVQEVDVRNRDGAITSVDGVNKEKQFMPTVASGEDITKYKVVGKNCFACNLMHVGRDVAVPIALNTEDQPIIVSPAYLVFAISDSKVLPKYALIWMSRSETDRYAWFMCDASVRSGMEKSRFYDIDIPVPSIEEQKALVEVFEVLSLRRDINERLKAQIRDICPILIKGSLEEETKQ